MTDAKTAKKDPATIIQEITKKLLPIQSILHDQKKRNELAISDIEKLQKILEESHTQVLIISTTALADFVTMLTPATISPLSSSFLRHATESTNKLLSKIESLQKELATLQQDKSTEQKQQEQDTQHLAAPTVLQTSQLSQLDDESKTKQSTYKHT